MRVPIFHRYILRNFSGFFLLSLFVFTSLFIMVNFVQIVNQGILKGFSFYFMGKSLLYMLPNISAMTLPPAFLMALLLSLGRMSQDGEIAALRAGGFSFSEILAPVCAVSILIMFVLAAVNNWAGPACLHKSTEYTLLMVNKITKLDLKPKTFHKISEWVIYSDEVDSDSGRLKNVKLIKRINKTGSPAYITRINASEGNYGVIREKGIRIELKSGQFTQADFRDREKLICGDFSAYKTFLPFFSAGSSERKLSHREMTTAKLLRELNISGLEEQARIKYKIEVASRFVMIIAPAIFFLIGSPLGVALEKKGRAAGFAASLLVVFFYYGFVIASVVLARKYEALFPWIIAAPGLCGIVAGWLMWKRRLYAR